MTDVAWYRAQVAACLRAQARAYRRIIDDLDAACALDEAAHAFETMGVAWRPRGCANWVDWGHPRLSLLVEQAALHHAFEVRKGALYRRRLERAREHLNGLDRVDIATHAALSVVVSALLCEEPTA